MALLLNMAKDMLRVLPVSMKIFRSHANLSQRLSSSNLLPFHMDSYGISREYGDLKRSLAPNHWIDMTAWNEGSPTFVAFSSAISLSLRPRTLTDLSAEFEHAHIFRNLGWFRQIWKRRIHKGVGAKGLLYPIVFKHIQTYYNIFE